MADTVYKPETLVLKLNSLNPISLIVGPLNPLSTRLLKEVN